MKTVLLLRQVGCGVLMTIPVCTSTELLQVLRPAATMSLFKLLLQRRQNCSSGKTADVQDGFGGVIYRNEGWSRLDMVYWR